MPILVCTGHMLGSPDSGHLILQSMSGMKGDEQEGSQNAGCLDKSQAEESDTHQPQELHDLPQVAAHNHTANSSDTVLCAANSSSAM